MIEEWEAKIKAQLPGNLCPGNDLSVINFIFGENKKNNNSVRIANIYMFSKIEILNPIYARQESNGLIYIHPGLNRYIGACFKDQETWLDAKIFVKGEPHPTPGVEWHRVIAKHKKKDAFFLMYEKNKVSGPAVEATNFLIEKSQNARIELYYGKNTVVFNPNGEKVISADIKYHNGAIPALKEIFKQVDKGE